MQKYSSTVNLHNIGEEIYLGYLDSEPFKPTSENYQTSFFGGRPIWLQSPSKDLCKCEGCGNYLTFLGQIYCPFNADYCYHRILYVLFCQKCLHYFRCIRQQTTDKWNSQQTQKIQQYLKKEQINIKIISQNAFQMDNQSMLKKQLNKIMNKAKIQLQQERAIQQAPSDEQAEQQVAECYVNDKEVMIPKQLDEKQTTKIQERQESKQAEIDYVLQHYKKVMKQINNPSMLYTNLPVLYNNQPVNPKHLCSKCGGKIELQVQLTEQLLLMNLKQNNERLLLMDWGSIMIYTCSNSCSQSQEEELIIQYEIDPINENQIKKLKKKKKNKKKAEQKAKSKSKSKSRSKSKQKTPVDAERQEDNGDDWD